MTDAAPGTLIYPSPGVLIQEGEFDDPQPIVFAHRTAPDTLSMRMMSGQDSPYTIDPNTLQSYNAGIVKFQDANGTAFQIRPLADSDGEWLSHYETAVPARALSDLVAGYNNTEGTSRMSAYLNHEREAMVAFQFPGDDFLFGLLYINQFGGYIRIDGSWVLVAPDDDTFDETYPYLVAPETVDDFLAAWDKGAVAVDDAVSSKWVARPEDQQAPQTAADDPAAEDAPEELDPQEQTQGLDVSFDSTDDDPTLGEAR